MMQMWTRKYLRLHISSFRDSFLQWFVVLSYVWQWWTLRYGCYCRVSNCCLSLHLYVARDYDRVVENTFGVLEKSWNLFLARHCEPWINKVESYLVCVWTRCCTFATGCCCCWIDTRYDYSLTTVDCGGSMLNWRSHWSKPLMMLLTL